MAAAPPAAAVAERLRDRSTRLAALGALEARSVPIRMTWHSRRRPRCASC